MKTYERAYQTDCCIVEKSGGHKVKGLSVSYVPQTTCPNTCSFKNNGCYGESGPSAFTMVRLHENPLTPLQAAHIEAKKLMALTGKNHLRTHVVGDCSTPETAGIVGQAMVDYENRTGKLAWTYTHSWKTVKLSDWNGAFVNASLEHASEQAEAEAMGYVSFFIPADDHSDTIQCLKETLDKDCKDCLLCRRVTNKPKSATPHGAGKAKVRAAIA